MSADGQTGPMAVAAAIDDMAKALIIAARHPNLQVVDMLKVS